MAKKPQRLTQSLGRLRALEQDVAVVSNPVDTFTRAAPITESTRARDIEKGLARLSPIIAGLVAERTAKQQDEDIQEGFTRYKNASEDEKDESLKIIKETDPRNSEFWMEGYARAHVNAQANNFATPFSLEFARVKDNPDFNYETFSDQFTQQYILDNGLDAFDDDILIDNFFGRIEGIVNQRRQNHNEQEMAEVVQARQDLTTGELDTLVADAQVYNVATGTVTLDTNKLTTDVNTFVETTIGRDANTAVTKAAVLHFETLAKRFAADGEDDWKVMLAGMASVPLKVGTYGDTSEGAAKIEQLSQQLEKTARDAELQDMQDHETRMKFEAQGIENSMIQAVNDDPSLGESFGNLNSGTTFMHDGEEMTIKDAFTFIALHNPTRHQQLQIYGLNYQIEARVTDPKVYQDISEVITTLPQDKLEEMIENNSHLLSEQDAMKLKELAADSKVLADVEKEVNPNGFTLKQEFQDVFKNPVLGGYDAGYQREVGKMVGQYTEEFDLFRAGLGVVDGKVIGEVDLNTKEGKALYRKWKNQTINKIIQKYETTKQIKEMAELADEANRPKMLEMENVGTIRGMVQNWVAEKNRIDRGGAGDIANTDLVKFLAKYREIHKQRTGRDISFRVALDLLEKELKESK